MTFKRLLLILVVPFFFITVTGQIDVNCSHDSCIILNYAKLSNRFKSVNLDTAFHYAGLSLKHARSYEDTVLLIKSINNLAEVQFMRSEYSQSIDLSLELIGIHKRRLSWDSYYEMHLNIAGIYEAMGNHDEALKNINEALNYWRKTKNEIRASQAYLARTEIWRLLGVVDSAYSDIKIALEYLVKDDSLIVFYAVACNSYGNILVEKELIDSAIFYMKKSYHLLDSLGNDYLVVTSLNNLALVYEDQCDTERAMEYYSKTLSIARELKSNEVLSKALGSLSNFYFEQGKYEIAYSMLIEFDSIKNLVFNEQKEKQFLEIEAKYQAQQKENEIGLLEKKNEARELKLQQKNYTIWILSAIIILLGLLLFLNVQRIRANSEKNAKKLESEILRAQISPRFIRNSLAVIFRPVCRWKNV
jgi:tetratricopeptide (TPR) repeat protein